MSRLRRHLRRMRVKSSLHVGGKIAAKVTAKVTAAATAATAAHIDRVMMR